MTELVLKRPPTLWDRVRRALSVLLSMVSLQEKTETEQEQVSAQAARLLDEYGNSVLRLAFSYLHNRSDAEDILQDALVQFLKTAPVLASPAHEKAWLLRVAANLSKNRLRDEKRRETDELNEELIAREREDLSFVWDAVKSLPVNQREAVHLFYYEGWPTAMIAEQLGRKEATVRSDLRRGREKLKELLKEAYDLDEQIPTGP